MKIFAIIVILAALPELAFNQQNDVDSAVIKRLYGSGRFVNSMEMGKDASKAVALVGIAAFTVISYGTFSMRNGFTLVGTGLSGLAFIGSIESCVTISKAKFLMESYGFDKYPGYRLYRKVINTQYFTIFFTAAGLGCTSLAIYGAVVNNDLAFGLGFGGTLACTVAVSFIPSMLGKILDIYNKGNPSTVAVGISRDGIGLAIKIR
jgi:hypothetical protein